VNKSRRIQSAPGAMVKPATSGRRHAFFADRVLRGLASFRTGASLKSGRNRRFRSREAGSATPRLGSFGLGVLALRYAVVIERSGRMSASVYITSGVPRRASSAEQVKEGL
jgi:hypothetical protein